METSEERVDSGITSVKTEMISNSEGKNNSVGGGVVGGVMSVRCVGSDCCGCSHVKLGMTSGERSTSGREGSVCSAFLVPRFEHVDFLEDAAEALDVLLTSTASSTCPFTDFKQDSYSFISRLY